MAAQLYFLTPIIFLSLYFCPAFGLALTFTILVICPVFIISPRLFSNLPTYIEMTKLYTPTDYYKALTYYHFSPLQYVTAMCMGLLTGYLIIRKPNLMMPGGRKVAILTWWLSLTSLIWIFLWNCTFWKLNLVVPSGDIMLWFVVSKFVGTFFMSYTAYLCCTGRSSKFEFLYL